MNQLRIRMASGARFASRAVRLPLIFSGVAAIALGCFGGLGSLAVAQDAAEDDSANPRAIAKPTEMELETEDGVTLAATYYASNKGKDAVPVLLLHAHGGSQADFKELALGLQSHKSKCAVLTLDLRGHGGSKQTKAGIKLNATALRAADFAKMALDLEAAKRFLLKENNAKKLNIEKLCIVAAEMSTVVALDWAARDWSARDLGQFKQGRDVKALVLLSPESNFKGFSARRAMAHPAIRSKLSVLLVVGSKNRKATSNALRMYNLIARGHRKGKVEMEPYLAELPVNYQGAELLGSPTVHVKSLKSPSLQKTGKTGAIAASKLSTEELIKFFIASRLADNKDLRWTDRSDP